MFIPYRKPRYPQVWHRVLFSAPQDWDNPVFQQILSNETRPSFACPRSARSFNVPYHCVCSPVTSIAKPKSASSGREKQMSHRIDSIKKGGGGEGSARSVRLNKGEVTVPLNFQDGNDRSRCRIHFFLSTHKQCIEHFQTLEINFAGDKYLLTAAPFVLLARSRFSGWKQKKINSERQVQASPTFRSLCTILLSWQCRTASRTCWMQWLERSPSILSSARELRLTSRRLHCRILEQRYLRIILHQWL